MAEASCWVESTLLHRTISLKSSFHLDVSTHRIITQQFVGYKWTFSEGLRCFRQPDSPLRRILGVRSHRCCAGLDKFSSRDDHMYIYNHINTPNWFGQDQLLLRWGGFCGLPAPEDIANESPQTQSHHLTINEHIKSKLISPEGDRLLCAKSCCTTEHLTSLYKTLIWSSYYYDRNPNIILSIGL
mgnify:CR=1 FL=1